MANLKSKNYLYLIKQNCSKTFDSLSVDLAVPHQSISPREMLLNWVRNDTETVIHERTEDWNEGNIHPNSIREFEDRFEALEYLSELKNSPVTLDNLGNPSVDEPPAESSSAPGAESSSAPGANH